MPLPDLFKTLEQLLQLIANEKILVAKETQDKLIRALRFFLTAGRTTLTQDELFRRLHDFIYEFEHVLRYCADSSKLVDALIFSIAPHLRSLFSPRPTPGGSNTDPYDS